MIKLTERQLYDFLNCPALFEMKYIKKLPIQESQTFSSYLTTVGNYFYINLLNEKISTLSDLKRKWDSVCAGQNFTQKQVLDGMHEVARFANWMGNEQPIVLDINTPYTIVVGDVELSGNMSPIFKKKDRKELVITDFSSKLPDQRVIDMKLKYTVEAYAFRELYQEEFVGIRVHNVKHNKDLYTNRTEADFNRMKTTIKGVSQAIQSEAFFARDSFMCPTCPAFTYCRFWTRES